MIQQASTEFGFDTDNFPVMIEAIPVSPDCLILVITKVEDPDKIFVNFDRVKVWKNGNVLRICLGIINKFEGLGSTVKKKGFSCAFLLDNL